MDIENIVILTGAGISVESGIPAFRTGTNALWEGHRVEDVATPGGFQRDPVLVQQFYNARRAKLKTVEPNAAHYALAKLAANWKGNLLLVTQNVDDLHDRAHAAQPAGENFHFIHLHGELNKARHLHTGEVKDCSYDLEPTGDWRPHIVWFEEMPFELETIDRALKKCDMFVSIGTSGGVYPAADFVNMARNAGAYTVEINPVPSYKGLFHENRIGRAGAEVPKWVDEILKNPSIPGHEAGRGR